MKTARSLAAMGTCLWWFAQFNAFSQAAETPSVSPERFQELEKAVQAIQRENQELRQVNGQLRKRVEELEHQRAGVQPAAAVPTNAASAESKPNFVLPSGKEAHLKLGGYVQLSGEFGDAGSMFGVFPDSKVVTPIHQRIFLRRARVNVTGDFLENFDFKVEGDFENGDGISGNRTGFSASDIFLNWHLFPEANIKVGQYKAPFGVEQTTPDTAILTIERSQPTGALTPERQIGVQLWGKPLVNLWPKQKDLLEYAFGVFNGNNRNSHRRAELLHQRRLSQADAQLHSHLVTFPSRKSGNR